METEHSWRQALFNPRSIALVGLSNDSSRLTGAPIGYLQRNGYQGKVQIVNPRSSHIQGCISYPDIASLDAPVDHVYLLINTDDAVQAISDCAAAGAKVVTILAGGFSDAGPSGLIKQQSIVNIARDAGIRIVGPNSLGIANLNDGVVLSTSSIFKIPDLLPGGIALLSQSGGMMGALVSRANARGIGFSKVVSVGNEADLGVGEIGESLVSDRNTSVFMLFLESIKHPEAIIKFAEQAHKAGKPILAYMLGRSSLGQEMAVSHTGAIVGSDRAAEAFLKQLGIIRIDNFEALIEAAPLFAHRRPIEVRAPAIGVVATTGGGAALVVDALGTRGANVLPPSQSTVDALAAMGVDAHGGRIVDLTLAGTKTETVVKALAIMRNAPEFDLVLAVVGSSSQFHPEIGVKPIAQCNDNGKPVVAFLGPDAQEGLAILAKSSIAAFRTPEACADAINAFVTWKAPASFSRHAEAQEAVKSVLSAFGGKNPDELGAAKLFASLGVSMVRSERLPLGSQSLPATPFPLAIKVLSADITHKTEVGGVKLNICSRDELEAAKEAISANVAMHCPDARIEGFVVQPMATGRAEVLVGYRRDPQVGPIITLAAGGVLAELYQDSAVRLAPVSREEAREMIAEVKSLALISGYRNLPRGDLDALANIVTAVSTLAAYPQVKEAEINPVLIRDEACGAVAVDALVSLEREEAKLVKHS